MAKSALEKELKKHISFKLVVLFILFCVIGTLIGAGYKFISPKEDYTYELVGEEIVVVESKDDYKEESVKVCKNGEVISANVVIKGEVKEDVGVYYLTYEFKDIKKLEGKTLQRIVIIKGTTSDEESEDSV